MSVQIALLAPATRVASRKLGPTAGSRSNSPAGRAPPAGAAIPEPPGAYAVAVARASPPWTRRPPAARGEQSDGLGDEQVGEHVRQVRDAPHQPVVGVGVDRLRPRPEAAQQPVQTLVEDTGGAAFGGGQIPGGAVEQVLAGVLHAGGLGARQRVPADEALIGAGGGEHVLGRADVADDAVRPAAASAWETVSASAPTGVATNTTSAPSTAAAHVRRLRVDRAQLERSRAHALVGVIATHLGVGAPARGQADRAADQPDAEDRDLQGACPVARPIRRR